MADPWKTLGSVVGLGVGSMELDVEGRAFTFGDTVCGQRPVIELVRDASGCFSELTFGIGGYRGAVAARFEGMMQRARSAEDVERALRFGALSHLATIPASSLRRITVRLPETPSLRKAITRFTAADVSIPASADVVPRGAQGASL